MNKKNGNMVMTLLAIFCIVVLFSATTAYGEDHATTPELQHKIVRLYEKGGIEPQQLTIKPGTTVIWINESKSLAEIEFTDKKVTMACGSPVRFVVDDRGTYVSEKIFRGTVASLCFTEVGEFEYAVKREPRKSAAVPAEPPVMKGTISVK
jgi:plastocyanin